MKSCEAGAMLGSGKSVELRVALTLIFKYNPTLYGIPHQRPR